MLRWPAYFADPPNATTSGDVNIDFATKAAKVDDNGVPVYTVPVFMAGSGIKDSISIKVSGEVKGLSEFTLVKITNLIAQTWEVGTNHGVSFKADRIDVAKAPA